MFDKFSEWEMTPIELENKLFKLCQTSNEQEKSTRQFEKVFHSLLSFKDEYLAKITNQQEGKSHAEKERGARISKEWDNYKHELQKAEDDYLDKKTELKCSQREWETLRSILSSKNSERRMM